MTLQQSETTMDDVLESLVKKLTIKLTEQEEKIICTKLPKLKELQHYESIYQLEGQHTPCIHDAIPNIAQTVKMKKSRDGKKVLFACKTKTDAESAVEAIRDKLGKYGYKPTSKDNFVRFETSELTSISPLLSRLQLRVLFCKHDKLNEKIIFGKTADTPNCDLRQKLQDAEEKASEELCEKVIFPKKIRRLGSHVDLPDCEFYGPKFIAFLIEENPTTNQLYTYLALYHLAELGIPFPYIHERNLIRIINQYVGVSSRTLEKQLIENEFPLHKRLANNYSFAELEISMSSDLIPQNSFSNMWAKPISQQ